MEPITENKQEQKTEWLNQLENDIIPWAERLLEKEKEHNDFLRNAKVDLEINVGKWYLPWQAETEDRIDDIINMISYSNSMLNHINARLEEYKQFLIQEKLKIK